MQRIEYDGRRSSKRLAMKKQGLLTPSSKTRLEHLEGAAPKPGVRETLRTSYELTKGGNLRWKPASPEEVPVLGDHGRSAITRGMQTYYDEMIGIAPNNLTHLETVDRHVNMELVSRENKLAGIERERRGSAARSDPVEDRVQALKTEHLLAERDALNDVKRRLAESIRELKGPVKS